MRHGILVLSILLLPVASLTAQSGSTIDEARVSVEKWVETRQLTSRLQADWRAEREMIEQTLALFEKELAELQEKLAKADTSTSQVGAERAKLEAEKKELEEASARVTDWATRFEERIRKLAIAFPPTLATKLDPLMKRLPADSATTRLGPVERMQNLVGILNEVDKFNGSIVVESELQKRPSGEEIQVKTLYVGLGQAYFVDKTGDFAGVGQPSLKGWEWKEEPGLGGRVLDAIASYEDTRPPGFVELPMTVN
ncbi:MAG: DUF3450 domain-containing protein [Verrucomicrobia bacterium]|nr:DUF3450 domain-containing protein [Verrucomicrobiota bacterium]